MSIAVIGIITALFGMLATLRSSTQTLTVLCIAALLGAASALALGSANITPGHLCVGFFVLAVLIRKNAVRYALPAVIRGRPGIFLVVLSVWALVAGYAMPRIFAGDFMVFPLNSATKRILEVPLYPSSANFNQAVYFLSGPLIFLATSSLARSEKMLWFAARALIFAGIFNLFIVAIDTVTFAAGMTEILSFARNADYAQLFSHQWMGIKRVTGTFPEASSYASVAALLFAFNFRLWRGGVMTNLTGPTALFTFVSILFSFSSTGYAALFAYIAVAYSGAASGLTHRESNLRRSSTNRLIFLSLGPMAALGAAIAAALNPALLDPILATFDNSVTSKLGSASGLERTSWNMSGLNAFFQTWGLGAGTGSVRTSSFVVAVMGNLGVMGMILFACFFARLFLSKPERMSPGATIEMKQIASAARAGAFTYLVAASVSHGSIDLGIHFYVCAGIICASVFYTRTAPVRLPDQNQNYVPTAAAGALGR